MAALVSQILTQLQAVVDLSIASVTWRTGAQYLEEREPNPRVVWVPGKDEFGAASGNGRNGSSTRTRQAEIIANVFGDDLEKTEALVHAIAYAAHVKTHGSYTIDTCDWSLSVLLERGYHAALRLQFFIPVTRPASLVVTPTVANDPTGIVPGDGKLDSGES